VLLGEALGSQLASSNSSSSCCHCSDRIAALANTSGSESQLVITQVVVAAAAALLLLDCAALGLVLSSSRGSDRARQAKGIVPVAVAVCPSATLRLCSHVSSSKAAHHRTYSDELRLSEGSLGVCMYKTALDSCVFQGACLGFVTFALW
jgi:hypothetical protein